MLLMSFKMSSCQAFVVIVMLVITGVGSDVLLQGLLKQRAQSSVVKRRRCRPSAFVANVAELQSAAIADVFLMVRCRPASSLVVVALSAVVDCHRRP
jgi:hypothetical protein